MKTRKGKGWNLFRKLFYKNAQILDDILQNEVPMTTLYSID